MSQITWALLPDGALCTLSLKKSARIIPNEPLHRFLWGRYLYVCRCSGMRHGTCSTFGPRALFSILLACVSSRGGRLNYFALLLRGLSDHESLVVKNSLFNNHNDIYSGAQRYFSLDMPPEYRRSYHVLQRRATRVGVESDNSQPVRSGGRRMPSGLMLLSASGSRQV